MRLEGGRLVASAANGTMTGEMEHWHYDVFRARWAEASMGTSFLTFTIDPEGRAAWVRVDGRQLAREAAPAATQ